MPKTPIQQTDKQFNLKFLLVGDSGSGKTHFCGTYTRGPVHFYMLDQGGEKTLYKLIANRPSECPITADYFSMRKNSYLDFWKALQQDEKDGFFDEMAEKNGLIVMPDSLTAASDLAMQSIARANQRTLTEQSKPMRMQDWGQLGAQMKELISVANDLPCAVAVTAHIHSDTGESGAIIARYPMISGQFRYTMGRMFDEVYLLETFGTKRRIVLKEKNMFNAKSRFFECAQLTDVTMDIIADAYLKGDTLKNQK